MRLFFFGLSMLNACIFCDIQDVRKEIEQHMKNRRLEMNTLQLDNPKFWFLSGEMSGLLIALETIEIELYCGAEKK